MKRFKIELKQNGVAIWDRVNKLYVIDASIMESGLYFTIHKRGVKRRKQFKWESKIEYFIKDVNND